MQTHRCSCLDGPTSRFRGWGQGNSDAPHHTGEFPDLREVAGDDDPDFRADLVARVRREIADGTYDTEEKFEIALGCLLRHLDEMA
jgi:hypothetical protein